MSLIFTGGKEMENEFYLLLHPETRLAISELHVEMNRDLTITEVCRTDADSERIYMQIAERLLASQGKDLGVLDFAQWNQLRDLSPLGVTTWARLRTSWHKAWTAVDVGLNGWSPRDLALMAEYIHHRCQRPAWETITEFHGTGPHLHLARRDFTWLQAFPGGLRSAQGKKTPPPSK